MLFTKWANDNVFLLSLTLLILFLIAFVIGSKNGGWSKHMAYFWTMIVFIPYILLSPLFFYAIGRELIIGTDISAYYGLHFFYSCLAILFFLIGYWIIAGRPNAALKSSKRPEFRNAERIITLLFYTTYGIVMLNMAAGGINIANVFLGSEVVGLGAQGASYYLQNFADSLISVLIIGYLYGVPKRKLLTWVGLSFFLFFLLGFRYRIILTLSGLILAYLFKHKVEARQVVLGLVLGILGLYFIIFSTMNRQALIYRQYEKLVYDPFEFKAEGFFEQSRGALADMAIYKLYDDPNKVTPHDYGMTMFVYVFIRMIPRIIYPEKDEFYPPPQLKIQGKSYFAWWASRSGEACLSSGAIYIAWGFYGIMLAHMFWGIFLKKFANKIRFDDPLSLVGYIIVALATFQWISRGYFPQAIDHFAYLMFPIWGLRYISKRNALKEVERGKTADN
jgi:hypothetical protein